MVLQALGGAVAETKAGHPEVKGASDKLRSEVENADEDKPEGRRRGREIRKNKRFGPERLGNKVMRSAISKPESVIQ